jgi:hypothetical protein
MRILPLIGATLGMICLSLSVGAAQQNEPIKTLKCSFTRGISTRLDGEKTANTKTAKGMPDLVVDQIDDRAGTARLIGNVAADDAEVRRIGNVMHIFDFAPLGGMWTLTVIDLNKIQATVPVRAVLSGHIVSPDLATVSWGIDASQYYGSCVRFD